MNRHFLIAAWRNLLANPLQSAIAIFGLSVGIAVALIVALVLRNQTTFDHFIPGYEQIYIAATELTKDSPFFDKNGPPIQIMGIVDPRVADSLHVNMPEVDSVYMEQADVALARGQILSRETLYWTDPEIFTVFQLPVLFGDLQSSLKRPDGLVLSLSSARKYFGRDNVVGQIISVDDHPKTVRAVIADLPHGATNLQFSIFASSQAPESPMGRRRANPPRSAGGVSFSMNGLSRTYIRIKTGVAPEAVFKKISAVPFAIWPAEFARKMPLRLLRSDQINLSAQVHPENRNKFAIALLMAVLILFVACVNFVNLLTARAARRGIEIGMRKVCGARRRTLIVQFLGETLITVLAATICAIVMAEWAMPSVNAFLDTGATFNYWREPVLLFWLAAGVLSLALLAGAYPAFVLSAFHPAAILKGWISKTRSGVLVRNLLVTLQFAILIGLTIAAILVYQQHLFATRDALRLPTDQMLVIRHIDGSVCGSSFLAELRKLASVRGAGCTATEFMGERTLWGNNSASYRGREIDAETLWLDATTYGLYGISPLAGSLERAGQPGKVVINKTLSLRLGFALPNQAIGQSLLYNKTPSEIVAVVPDFTLQEITHAMPATLYGSDPRYYTSGEYSGTDFVVLNVKLSGRDVPEALAAIDALWHKAYPVDAIDRYFLDARIQERYLAILRMAQLFALCSAIAILLACLGLLGLSMSIAERRTKEIGVRKAMGAGDLQIGQLLLAQFAKPVLWANLIAWPTAFYFLNDWLNGFARHIALGPWPFIAAALLAVFIALATVLFQAIRTARAVPATALRYE